MEALLLFLCISSEHKIFFSSLAGITALPLVFNWKYILVISFVFVLILFVYELTKPSGELPPKINSTYNVNSTISMGAIISVDGSNVLIKTKEVLNQYDQIKVTGDISKVINTSDFDLVTYLKSLNVFYLVKRPTLNLVAKSNDIRILAREYVSSGGE